MAFGLRNAPATFSRFVTKVFKGLEDLCEPYLDDVMVLSQSWQDHITHLEQVFERIILANLTPNLKKSELANAKFDSLGHIPSLNPIQPRQQQVEALFKFPAPKSRKQVKSLLGLASYYRKFLSHFALTKLRKRSVLFELSTEARNTFVDLKSRLASRPILRPPNYDVPFLMAVDA